ncbi:MAG: hypothetical protein ABIV47_06325 [Roseiflexaceae bacterium]
MKPLNERGELALRLQSRLVGMLLHFQQGVNWSSTASEIAADFIPAINQILHDQAHPSHVILPIIERG